MPRGTHPNSLANLNQFSSTHQPANGGRKPSKLKLFLKENNVSNEDVGRIIRNVLFNYTMDQLFALEHDDKKLMIIRLVARAFRADWKRGSLQNFETLLTRALGAPKVDVNLTGGLNLTVMSPEVRRARIDTLLDELDFNRRQPPAETPPDPREAGPDEQTGSPGLPDSEPLAPH